MLKILLYITTPILTTYLLFIRHSQKILSKDTYLYILAHVRHPHHYLPSKFAPIDYLLFSVLLIVLIGGLAYFYKKKHSKKVTTQVVFTVTISFILCLSAYVFAEIYPIRQIIEVQPFRIIYLLRWLAMTVGFAAICEFACSKISKTSAALLFILFTTSLVLFWPGKTMRLVPNLDTKYESDRVALYEYVSDNTDPSSLFLTPPDFGSMRIIPKRAIVVDWKSFPFNEVSMSIWYDKITTIYGLSEQDQNYHRLTDKNLDDLQAKYDFDYAVLYKDTYTAKPVIYQDDHHKLVKTK